MSGEEEGREDAGGRESRGYTIAVDDDGRVTLHLDGGEVRRVGRIEEYPALRRKLGEEGVLDAVREAAGDDVNVRRAAPGETDKLADDGDDPDIPLNDLRRRLRDFIKDTVDRLKARREHKRSLKRKAIKRGETQVVTHAPTGAVRLMLGDGNKRMSVPVGDGSATIDAATSDDMDPGLWETEWRVEVDGGVRMLPGPKIKVAAAATDTRESLGQKADAVFNAVVQKTKKLSEAVSPFFDIKRDFDENTSRREKRKADKEDRAELRRQRKRERRESKRKR